MQVRTDGANYKKISIYGGIRSLKTDSSEGPSPPGELNHALRQVVRYDANASAWMPEYIEVMICPFEYAKQKAAWPTEWPGLADPKTIRCKDMYSIFVPASQYEKLKKFMDQLSQAEAVKIDNKQWAVSARFPFPHEQFTERDWPKFRE